MDGGKPVCVPLRTGVDYHIGKFFFIEHLNGPFWNEGNFDGDGDTDITDFNLLAANFSPSGYSTSAIPEPSTMLLASLALVLVGVSFRLSKNDCD